MSEEIRNMTEFLHIGGNYWLGKGADTLEDIAAKLNKETFITGMAGMGRAGSVLFIMAEILPYQVSVSNDEVVRYNCPECGYPYQMPASFQVTVNKCQDCGHEFTPGAGNEVKFKSMPVMAQGKATAVCLSVFGVCESLQFPFTIDDVVEAIARLHDVCLMWCKMKGVEVRDEQPVG